MFKRVTGLVVARLAFGCLGSDHSKGRFSPADGGIGDHLNETLRGIFQ